MWSWFLSIADRSIKAWQMTKDAYLVDIKIAMIVFDLIHVYETPPTTEHISYKVIMEIKIYICREN